MNEVCQKAKEFLTEIVSDMKLDLTVSNQWTEEGCVLNLNDPETMNKAFGGEN